MRIEITNTDSDSILNQIRAEIYYIESKNEICSVVFMHPEIYHKLAYKMQQLNPYNPYIKTLEYMGKIFVRSYDISENEIYIA